MYIYIYVYIYTCVYIYICDTTHSGITAAGERLVLNRGDADMKWILIDSSTYM